MCQFGGLWLPLPFFTSISCYLTALVRVGQQRVVWCSFGCHLLVRRTRRVYYTVFTVNLSIYPGISFFPWNRMTDVFHSGGIAVLMQSFVSTLSLLHFLPQTVYSVRSVQAEQLGVDCIDRKCGESAGGQMVQASVLWSWQCEWSYPAHASIDRGKHTETASLQQAVQNDSGVNSLSFYSCTVKLSPHNRNMLLSAWLNGLVGIITCCGFSKSLQYTCHPISLSLSCDVSTSIRQIKKPTKINSC